MKNMNDAIDSYIEGKSDAFAQVSPRLEDVSINYIKEYVQGYFKGIQERVRTSHMKKVYVKRTAFLAETKGMGIFPVLEETSSMYYILAPFLTGISCTWVAKIHCVVMSNGKEEEISM